MAAKSSKYYAIMGNQYLVVAFSIFCALLTMTPEIAAYIANRKNWVPINIPRLMPGDDYHHFSILNKLSNSTSSLRIFFNCISSLARITKMQLPGYFILLPFYLVGSLFFGKRFAVSLVRTACRFALFFFATNLYIEILERLGFPQSSVLVGLICCSLFFLTYPGFSRNLLFQSILFTGTKRSNLIRTGSYSELTRTFILELSAPVFLFASFIVIKIETSQMVLKFAVAVFLIYLISSIYPPLAIVFLIFNSIEFYSESLFFLFSLVIVTFTIVFSIGLIMRSDEVGKEVFINSQNDRLFDFSSVGKRFVLEQIIIYGFMLYTIPSRIAVIIMLGMLMFGSFIKNHNLSRFWHRSGTLGFHLITILGFGTLISGLHEVFHVIIFLILISYLICFFFYTAIKNLSTGPFHLPTDLPYSEISLLDEAASTLQVVSSSPEKSFLYSLYGQKIQFWECYFLTNRNYSQNLNRYVQCQRIVGKSDDQILFTFFSGDSDLVRFMVFYLPYNFSASQKMNEKELRILINNVQPANLGIPIVIY